MDFDREGRRKPGAGHDSTAASPAPGKQTLAPALPPAAVAREADYTAMTAKRAEPDGVLLEKYKFPSQKH